MQELGISMVIGGVLASSFRSSFKNAVSSIDGIKGGINSLSKTKLDIKNFKKLSLDASKNKEALTRLGASLKKVGVDVNHLDKDSRQLRLSLVKLKKASKIDIRISGIKNQFGEQKAAIAGLGASLYGVTKLIGSANTVLKAQGEIRSLDISTKGIDAITLAGQKMSLQFGQITAPEFIRASYDIKSGIASLSDSGVKDFTRFAATTAVATKATTQEMTKLYALGYGIFRQDFSTDLAFGKQFSGAIAGAVQAFRTDGADLAGGMSNIGAAAQTMGVSLEEQLSIIGVSKGAFASASEAGSGYRAFLDGTGKAQKKLGLEFVDANGKMLPMVDILTKIKDKYGDLDLAEIDELKFAFGSAEAIKTITALLPKVDELTQSQLNLKQAMAGGLDKSEKMAKAMDSGYGFDKMGNAMSFLSFTIGKTLAPAVDLLATGLGKLAKGVAWLDSEFPMLTKTLFGIAGGFLAVVTVVKVAKLASLAYRLATLSLTRATLLNSAANNASALTFNRSRKASILARTATLATTAVTKTSTAAQWLFNASIIAGKAALGGIGKLLNAGKLLAFSAATKVAAGAQWVLNAALSANPIGLVIAGVAALATGAVILYKNFEPFTLFVDSIWDKLKGFFSFATDGFAKVGDVIGTAVSGVSSFFGFGEDVGVKPDAVAKKLSKPNLIHKTINTTALTAVALSSSIALANPLQAPQPLPLPLLVSEPITVPLEHGTIVPAVSHSAQKTVAVNQSNTIHITVNNPASTVDVATGVANGLRAHGLSLQDEEL